MLFYWYFMRFCQEQEYFGGGNPEMAITDSVTPSILRRDGRLESLPYGVIAVGNAQF